MSVCTFGLTCRYRETCSKMHIDMAKIAEKKKEDCLFGAKCTKYPKCPY